MIKNYFKTAWRSLIKNKFSSSINIGGLAAGMLVSLLISLWIYDELSFNKYHKNHNRIAQVMQKYTHNGEHSISLAVPLPLETELRNKYGSNFKHIVLSFPESGQILSFGEKKLSQVGKFMQPDGPEMFSLKMLRGTRRGLQDQSSILLSASTAKVIFGEENPMNEVIRINDKMDVKVTGVYEDLPPNSEFKNVKFISSFDLLVSNTKWMQNARTEWDNTSFQIFVELQPNSGFDAVSQKIKDAGPDNSDNKNNKVSKIVLLNPMNKWHLYNEWKNGENTSGRIQFVRLFGIIGGFVLLLACINFMNLYTAHSEKKAKEAGIRKTIGSTRGGLIRQFFSEALLVVLFAFIFCLFAAILALPWFNSLAEKQITIPWDNFYFWIGCAGFVLITAFLAGSYPAFYLSSFNAVKVLKGTFKTGRLASVPRKALVTFQFTVSIALIIGTIVVYRQIQYAKDRPVGYDRNGLLMLPVKTSGVGNKLAILELELKKSGLAEHVARSSSPLTAIWATGGGFTWKNMDANKLEIFGKVWITSDFGKTVGWQFIAGRDFSKDLATDSMPIEKNAAIAYSIVINEAAAKSMNMQNPVDEIIKWSNQPLRIIGVIKDMIMESPYEPAKPTIYIVNNTIAKDWVNIRINPNVSAAIAVQRIGNIFKQNISSMPFEYKFVDTEYGLKFRDEERIGRLSTVFAGLAIFISCLGLLGLASFMAAKRKKEIGIRKVLGASLFSVWRLLSGEFVALIFISLLISIPIAYYCMSNWLLNYQYRTEVSWWIFVIAGAGVVIVTLLTVSFQAIKAAVANPVKSLRSE